MKLRHNLDAFVNILSNRVLDRNNLFEKKIIKLV